MTKLRWLEVSWQRPLDPVRVADLLRQWAADQRSPHIALETRLRASGVHYLLGFAPASTDAVQTPFKALPNVSLRAREGERAAVVTAGRLKANTRHRPLRLNDPDSVVRAILATSVRLKAGEQLVVQVLLGPRRIPLAVPNASPSSVVQPWWSVAWMGNGGQIDGEKRSALRSKVADFGFACSIRLGVVAGTSDRRKALLLGLLAAVRVSEAPGVRLRLRREPPQRLNTAATPWRWGLRLGVPELVGLTAYPLGDDFLPGLGAVHPKRLPPAPGTTGKQLVIADALTEPDQQLVLPLDAATRHTHCVAPTGAGKSTLIGRWITQVINSGHGAVVIEPKGDLVVDIISRLSPEHRERVVVLDPNDPAPVGINPIATSPTRTPELVADGLLSVFKQLYGKALGARSQDILYAGLLTLAMHPDTSLVMLPLLYTNAGLRRSLTKDIRDPLTLQPFWATFEQWSDAERVAAVSPVMNKLRPVLRPGLRAVLGQRQPHFHLDQVFTERKVLLVPLQRGIIGPESARLLGSLVVAELWQAIQARAVVPAAQRHPVAVVIDEVQDYLHLPTDLAEALAQARGYGVGFVLAHQFMQQLPREMRSAVLANTLNRILFRLPHEDAIVFEKGHPELVAADLESLGAHEIYASLFARGVVNPYASARTQPFGPVLSDPAETRRSSRERYGQPLDEIEAGFAELYDVGPTNDLGSTGRRRRQP